MKNVRKKNLIQEKDENKQETKPIKQEDEEEIIRTNNFHRLIQLCDYLTIAGYVDIYTDLKELIKAEYFPDPKPKALPPQPMTLIIKNKNVNDIEIQSDESKIKVPEKDEKTLLDDLEDDLKD